MKVACEYILIMHSKLLVVPAGANNLGWSALAGIVLVLCCDQVIVGLDIQIAACMCAAAFVCNPAWGNAATRDVPPQDNHTSH